MRDKPRKYQEELMQEEKLKKTTEGRVMRDKE